MPLERHLVDTVHPARHREAGELEDRRVDVRDVVVLRSHRTGIGHPSGPVHDHRVGVGSPVSVALPPLERSVSCLRPPHRVMRISARTGQVVNVLEHLGHALVHRVAETFGVGGPSLSAFGTGTVIRQEHDESVVEHFEFSQRSHEPTDLGIGVVDKPGVDLHLAGKETTFVIGQVIPGRNHLVASRKVAAPRNDAEALLAIEDPLTFLVPAMVEGTAIVLDVLGRCMEGTVRRTEGQVQEEWTPRGHLLLIAQHGDHLVDDVLTDVIRIAPLAEFRRPGSGDCQP